MSREFKVGSHAWKFLPYRIPPVRTRPIEVLPEILHIPLVAEFRQKVEAHANVSRSRRNKVQNDLTDEVTRPTSQTINLPSANEPLLHESDLSFNSLSSPDTVPAIGKDISRIRDRGLQTFQTLTRFQTGDFLKKRSRFGTVEQGDGAGPVPGHVEI